MGYQKIEQYADIIETYEYEKNIGNPERKALSKLDKRRREERKKLQAQIRSRHSIARTRNSFFKLVAHNCYTARTITFGTITYPYDYNYEKCQRYNSRFFTKAFTKYKNKVPIRYISVPEKTKKGRWHFHILFFNIPTNEVKRERTTRNFQRQFGRGYVDFRVANFRSIGIAGYMAKYMAKSLTDHGNEIRRGFTCSRNIEKIRSYGSNQLDQYLDLIIGDNYIEKQKKIYDTQYLGECIKRIYQHK